MNIKEKIKEEIKILKTYPFIKDSIALQVSALASLGMSIIFSLLDIDSTPDFGHF